MLQIAVCGDDALVQAYLKEHINEYVEHEVCVIDGGQEALACGERYDILLVRREDEDHGARLTAQIRQQVLNNVCGNGREPLLVRANGSYYRIEREKILYAENVGRKVVLHMKSSEITYYAKMKELEEVLGRDFFRCHRGYLVNFKAVKAYEMGSILLRNGETILMAKQKYNNFVAAYAAYLHKK